MANLFNISKGQVETVSDEQVDDLIESGDYGFPTGEQVPLVKFGEELGDYYDPQKASELYESGEYFYNRQSADNKKIKDFESVEQLAKSAGTGLLQAGTLGFGEGALIDAGLIDPEASKMRDLAYPGTKIGSELVGDVGLTVLTGGGSLVGKAATKVGTKLGQKVAKSAVTNLAEKAVKKATGLSAKGMARTGLLAAGRGAGEDYTIAARNNESLDGEIVAENMIKNFAAGAVLDALGQKILKPRVKKQVDIKNLDTVDRELLSEIPVHEQLQKFNDTKDRLPIRYIRANIDGSEATHVGKGYEAVIDMDSLSPAIVDINDIQSLESYGKRYGVDGFGDYAFNLNKELIDSPDAIFDEMLSFRKQDLLKDTLALRELEEQTLSKASQADKKVSLGYARLKKRSLELVKKASNEGLSIAEKKELERTQRKLNDLMKGQRKTKGILSREAKKIDKQQKIIAPVPIAIKKGNELRVFNNDDLMGAIKAVKTQASKVELPLKSSSQTILKNIGLKPKALIRYGDVKLEKIADRARLLADDMPLGMKDFSPGKMIEKIANNKDQVATELESLYAVADNYADKVGGYSATNAELKSLLKRMVTREHIDNVTGEVRDALSLENAKGFIDEIFSTLPQGEQIAARTTRSIRQNADSIVNFATPMGDLPQKQAAAAKARKLLNEILIQMMDASDGSKKLSKKLKSLNNDYFELSILEDATTAQSAKNKLGSSGKLRGDLFAFALGGAPGLAIKFVTEKVRDKLEVPFTIALQDALNKEAGNKLNQIRVSAIGFVDKTSKAIFSPSVIATTLGTMPTDISKTYEKDVRNLEAIKRDAQTTEKRINSMFQEVGEVYPNVALNAVETTKKIIDKLDDTIPKPLSMDFLDSGWKPSEVELRKYHRTREYLFNPLKAIKDIKNGIITPESKDILKNIYPEMWRHLVMEIEQEMQRKKMSPMRRNEVRKRLGNSGAQSTRMESIKAMQNQRIRKADLNASQELTETQRLQGE